MMGSMWDATRNSGLTRSLLLPTRMMGAGNRPDWLGVEIKAPASSTVSLWSPPSDALWGCWEALAVNEFTR